MDSLMSALPLSHAADFVFYVFGAIALVFALRVVTAKNPISGAFSLVFVFFAVAAIYALMDAHFLAAIQILVYAGAIMVLFIFVIMLLNADAHDREVGLGKVRQAVAVASIAGVAYLVLRGLAHSQFFPVKGEMSPERIVEAGGNTRVLSEVLFSDFILPFELTSILLLVGIVGSVALAKRSKRLKGAKG